MLSRPSNVKYSTFRRQVEDIEELSCYPEASPEPENLTRHEPERHGSKRQHEDDAETDVNANMQPKLHEPIGAVAVQPRSRENIEVKLEMRGEEHPLDMAMEPNHSDRSCATEEDQTMMITPELLGLIPTSSLTSGAVAVQPRSRENIEVKLEMRGEEHPLDMAMEPNHSDRSCATEEDQTMMITPELLGLIPTSSLTSDASCDTPIHKSNKHWSQEDMDLALEALRTQSMNLTKASTTFGIPSTTLWQRAHRIHTPKKDSQAKSWSEADLNLALDELRAGRISANRASKTYRIPSSTLYKIARKEGIKFGTLYGRCKREGIELSKTTPVPWSSTDMTEALDAVRGGEMSINQAAIHYNLPYSSLYGRFKRVKFEDGKVDFEMYNSACSTDH
ncbi:hypothetical protein B566_EDAN016193 [Ephemera danica]|nr:hypothetical protein B566_EDAN016193 [Ephemera danica]